LLHCQTSKRHKVGMKLNIFAAVAWGGLTVHGEVYSIQHYVIRFVSDLQQDSGSPWVFQFPLDTNKTDCHDIAEILLEVALNTITPTHNIGWTFVALSDLLSRRIKGGMKLNIFAAVALAGLPKITILVAQQKLLGTSNWFCIWNIQNYSSQLGYYLKSFRGPG
jgi:urease gamma subunit